MCFQGYLSEAGASLIDQKLGLGVVPKTAVVSLAAPTFNYSAIDRAKARSKERLRARFPDLGRHFRRIGLPPKKGSFQVFVNGYKDASYWLRQWESNPEQALPPKTQHDFQLQFESMVVLDYIIRNTDRGNDNWLIKYTPAQLNVIKEVNELNTTTEGKTSPSTTTTTQTDAEQGPLIDFGSDDGKSLERPAAPSSTTDTTSAEIVIKPEEPTSSQEHNNAENEDNWEDISMPHVSIAAIDNGLAFPFKHPDQWRTYPYRWSYLSMAQHPFSEDTVQKILPFLDNMEFVRELGNDLQRIFENDGGFDKNTFAKQLSVIRGQIFNLREALRTRKSPAQLVQMPSQYMIEVKQKKKKKRRTIKTVEIRVDGDRTNLRLDVPTSNIEEITSDAISDNAGTSTAPEDANREQPATVPESETDPWHKVFQQKVSTKTAFFRMW
ncbi:phosphatidylinositol 3- and 4-kinase domain-containing protein [Ditylenchus destructor]|nr:phosphatidylinositol 3- and 4-kinase domain-containing protein [Ditylenchus destructor]